MCVAWERWRGTGAHPSILSMQVESCVLVAVRTGHCVQTCSYQEKFIFYPKTETYSVDWRRAPLLILMSLFIDQLDRLPSFCHPPHTHARTHCVRSVKEDVCVCV